jgi:hemagglutinin/hemolysin-like protein
MDQRERDLMEEVKAIIAEGAEANQSVVKEQPSVEPKAETKEATPDTKADDNKTKENIENNETKGDKEVASLQEQLLNGKSIADLEETAAGGGSAAGGNSGDGVSLGAANFAQGGHYSNITDDFRGLDSLVAKGTEEVSSIAGGADLDTLSVAIEKVYEAPVVVHETLRVSFDEVEDGRHDGNLNPNVSSHLDISNNILDNANSHKSGLQLTNDSTPTLAGKSTPGATISVFDGEGEHATFLGRTTVDANGDWEYTPTSALADGDHRITIEATKTAADGSELKESTHRDFTIDSVNDTLTMNISTDQVADLTGEATYLPSGTNVDTNLKFSGKAEANADIYLKILADDTTYDYYPDHAVPKGDIASILKTTADANGDWSISAEKPNWSYTYKAEVTSVDEAGNTHDYAPTTFYIPMESISVAPTDHL